MSNLELLTPENSTLILIDFQPQMTFGVASIDRQTLMNNVMLLAKSAKTFNVPTILTTVETRCQNGKCLLLPFLVYGLLACWFL